MSRQPSPRTVALVDEVRTALASSDRPLSTVEVARAVGVSPVGTEAYNVLCRLYDRGEVDRQQQPQAGTRVLYWTIPTQRTSEENNRG